MEVIRRSRHHRGKVFPFIIEEEDEDDRGSGVGGMEARQLPSPTRGRGEEEDQESETLLSASGRPLCLERNSKRAPEFTKRLNNQESVPLGSDIIFECQVTGFPPPKVTWYKDKQEVVEDRKYVIVEDAETGSNALLIERASKKEEGLYHVTARNVEGCCSSTAYLSLKGRSQSQALSLATSRHVSTAYEDAMALSPAFMETSPIPVVETSPRNKKTVDDVKRMLATIDDNNDEAQCRKDNNNLLQPKTLQFLDDKSPSSETETEALIERLERSTEEKENPSMHTHGFSTDKDTDCIFETQQTNYENGKKVNDTDTPCIRTTSGTEEVCKDKNVVINWNLCLVIGVIACFSTCISLSSGWGAILHLSLSLWLFLMYVNYRMLTA